VEPILELAGLSKVYPGGLKALDDVDLTIRKGEIFALLGPNGAGKTTLIGAVCGLVRPSSGTIHAFGYDLASDWRRARSRIGLVPQELSTDMFEPVERAVSYSRGLFGCKRDDAHIEKVLRDLSLWDKRNAKTMELSGGMKRRVLIAKALSHQPRVLFLDEPTAGVDVELRRDMWKVVAELKASGVTIILTTHYIEEAEAIADRVGVIAKGELLLIEEKTALMARMGRKTLDIELTDPVETIPASLSGYELEIVQDGAALRYSYDTNADRTGITKLLSDLSGAGLQMSDLQTRQSSLEEIFVDLVADNGKEEAA